MVKFTEADVIAAEEFVRARTGGRAGHGIEHALRVEQNAVHIIDADRLGYADVHLTRVCCLLHDVDDKKFVADGGKHPNLSAYCDERGLSQDHFALLTGIIDGVSYSDNPQKDDDLCIEAKIVQDADRLDALGAIGIARAFAYGGSTGRAIYSDEAGSTVGHFYEKLFKLPSLMHTAYGKAIADNRVGYMRAYLDRLYSEIDGKK